ncbi:MAG TPA: hypothetical protein VFV50_04625 [Bdellovibrionales bacterium]|nr:hypothetical protein [Bdellovibrionales bacterium]
MSDTQIKSVALFFFFAFFDEQKSLDLTARVIRLVRKKAKGAEVPLEVLIVQAAQKVLVKEAKRTDVAPPPQTLQTLQIPDETQLGYLHALRRKIALDEYSALVWTHIIGFPEPALAAGLGSTVGTIRHRNGAALRTLGQMIPPDGGARGI